MMLAGLALPWVMGWVGCVGFEEILAEVKAETGSSGDVATDGTTETTAASTTVEETPTATSTGGTTDGDTGEDTTGERSKEEKKWKPGELFASKTALRPALVFVPGGTFQMGSPETEVGRYLEELRHTARVDDFVMCNTEVTQGQYRAVTGKSPSSCGETGTKCGINYPVQNVSWNDACAYMKKLTDLENKIRQEQGLPALTSCYEKRGDRWYWPDHACTGFRLPTEAEWERAARAGKKTAYFFGQEAIATGGADILGEFATYGRLISEGPDAVAKKKRNPWGLYDIYGNVWEWCWDSYDSYRFSPPANYAGPETGDIRIVRGGSFLDQPRSLRSASRRWHSPRGDRQSDAGFRCVRALHPR